MKQNLEVIRHVRGTYLDRDTSGIVLKTSNMHGITLVFDLDYETGYGNVSWSVCHGENFNKATGAELARKHNQKLYFPLSNIKEFGGLKSGLVAYLQELGFIATPVTYLDVYSPLRKGLNAVNRQLTESKEG